MWCLYFGGIFFYKQHDKNYLELFLNDQFQLAWLIINSISNTIRKLFSLSPVFSIYLTLGPADNKYALKYNPITSHVLQHL